MRLKIGGLYILFVFILGPQISRSQPVKKDSLSSYVPGAVFKIDSSYITKYPLANFNKNYFQFYTDDSPSWEKFYDKISKMVLQRKGKLNFYHIGGSHLQADIYTHVVRTSLQTEWPKLSGERGWVFPFELGRTNSPPNYDFKSPNKWTGYRSSYSKHKGRDYGVLGTKIENSDSVVSLSFLYNRTEVRPKFTTVRVFHNKGYFPYEMNWGAAEMLRSKTFQDTTLGYTEFQFLEKLDSFNLQFSRTVSSQYTLEIYGFQLLNKDPGISYTAVGVNGAGLYNYLDCNRFEEQLKTYPPDFFAFSVGTNDGNVPYADFSPAVFKQNLDSMIQIVYRANPDCAILLTVPNDSYYKRKYLNRNITREREMMVELAQQYKLPIWDLYGIMGELGSSRKWYRSSLMKSDLVHFTRSGYNLKGEMFYDAFQKFIFQFGERRTVPTNFFDE